MASDVNALELPIPSDFLDNVEITEHFSTDCVSLEDSEHHVNLDLCLICHQLQDVTQAKQLISHYFSWSGDVPNVDLEDASVSSLDANLLSVFVLRRVLNYPADECVKTFQKTFGAVNPADWFVLCESCLKVTSQAYHLERELDRLKSEVRKQLKNSFTNLQEHGVGQVDTEDAFSIREMIRNYFKDENLFTLSYSETLSGDINDQTQENLETIPLNFLPKGHPRKSSLKGKLPFIETSRSRTVQKRGRGRPRKPVSEDQIPNKKEKQLFEEAERLEQMYFDTNDQYKDPSWSSNAGSDFEPNEENPEEEEYLPIIPKTNRNSKSFPGSSTTSKKKLGAKKANATKLKSFSKKPPTTNLPYRYTCDQCEQPFRHFHNYQRHMATHGQMIPASEETHDSTKRKYGCPDCTETFFTMKKQYEHRIAAHGAPNVFLCDLCPKRFTAPLSLKAHLLTHWRKPRQCDQCDKVLSSRPAYLIHMQNYHGHPNGEFPCETCGARMTTEAKLKIHQRIHTEKPTRIRPYKPVENPQKMYFYRFTCEECGKQYRKLQNYLRHLGAHKDGQTFAPPKKKPSLKVEDNLEPRCSINISTTDSSKLANLIALTKLASTSPMKCDVCCRCYIKPEELLEHIQKVHKTDDTDSIYTCQVCSHSFTSPAPLIIHMYVHVTSKQQICFVCHSTFPKRKNLLDHLTQEHGIPTTATCDHCQEHFSDLYTHKTHLQTTHDESDTFLCSVCEEAYSKAGGVMKHLYKHHKSKNRVYHCPDCSEVFFSCAKQHEHRVAAHGASSSFRCQVCFKEFLTPIGLRGHMQIHRRKDVPHQCELCEKMFNSKGNYTAHKKLVHTDEKPFTCEICGLSTKSKDILKRHRSTHDKKFVCEHCGRKFSDKHSLKNHVAMHSGEVMVCEECGHQFHARRYLLRHIHKFHKGDNPPFLKPQRSVAKPRANWMDRQDGKRYYAAPVLPPEEPFVDKQE